MRNMKILKILYCNTKSYFIKMDLESKKNNLIKQRDKINLEIEQVNKEIIACDIEDGLKTFLHKPVKVVITNNNYRTHDEDKNMHYQTTDLTVKYKNVNYDIEIKADIFDGYHCASGFTEYKITMYYGDNCIEVKDEDIKQYAYGIYKLPSKLILQMFCIMAMERTLVNFNTEYFNEDREKYLTENN